MANKQTKHNNKFMGQCRNKGTDCPVERPAKEYDKHCEAGRPKSTAIVVHNITNAGLYHIKNKRKKGKVACLTYGGKQRID
jgi:hypothetical protein